MRPISAGPYAIDRPPNSDLTLGSTAAADSAATGWRLGQPRQRLSSSLCTASLADQGHCNRDWRQKSPLPIGARPSHLGHINRDVVQDFWYASRVEAVG
jgi:hypothetical protein